MVAEGSVTSRGGGRSEEKEEGNEFVLLLGQTHGGAAEAPACDGGLQLLRDGRRSSRTETLSPSSNAQEERQRL